MKFGDIPVLDAMGAILAHSQHVGRHRLKKGTRLTGEEIAILRSAGVETVVAAQLEDGDVHEDAAAARLAGACVGRNLTPGVAATGRVNLFADCSGLVDYEPDGVDAVNAISEALTLAAVPPGSRVAKGQVVATIKIIPFAVPATALEAAVQAGAPEDGTGLIQLAPFTQRRIALIQTRLPGTPEKVLAKTGRTLRERTEDLGSRLVFESTVAHETATLAAALTNRVHEGDDIVLVVGASATTDRRDTIPSAIVAAGGAVDHFGMPVDPGNLVVLGHVGEVPVLALPGSARSPRPGGQDWLLWRLCAGLPLDTGVIRRMGVGGLLKESAGRPLPREEAAPAEPREPGRAWRIGAVVLAAGHSRRMGARNKLLENIADKPVVRHAVEAAVAAAAEPVLVVTGHDESRVRACLSDLPVEFARNPDPGAGMAASISTGIAALPPGLDGALILLGDMPAIAAATMDALIDAFDPAGGRTICIPEHQGSRGHPVLFARRFFKDLLELHGDIGARLVLRDYGDQVVAVPVNDRGILIDLDTPNAFADYRGGAATPPQV
jgi:molybdenum cofactor cytidylyltransferase